MGITPGSGLEASNAAVPMVIGARPSNATSGAINQFYGNISDVAVFNYALSASQVQTLYAAAPVPAMRMTPSNGNLVISYTGTLQCATNVTGPYLPVAGAPGSNYVVPTTNSHMFYRVSNP